MLVLLGQPVGLHPGLGHVLVHPLQLWLSLAIGPILVPDMLVLLGQPVGLHPGLGRVLVSLLQLLLPLLQLCLVLLLVLLQVSTPSYEKNKKVQHPSIVSFSDLNIFRTFYPQFLRDFRSTYSAERPRTFFAGGELGFFSSFVIKMGEAFLVAHFTSKRLHLFLALTL
jgi:hypothetical protein